MSTFLKAIIFYPMFWLRGLFLLVGRLLSGFLLLGGLLISFMAPDSTKWLGYVSLAYSFVFFLLLHFYDRILLWLNPTGNDLYLY